MKNIHKNIIKFNDSRKFIDCLEKKKRDFNLN